MTRTARRCALWRRLRKPQGHPRREEATPDGAALSVETKLLLARILRPEFQSESGAKFGLKILADFQEEVGRRKYAAGGVLRSLPGASLGLIPASQRWARTSLSVALKLRLRLAGMTGAYWLPPRAWTGARQNIPPPPSAEVRFSRSWGLPAVPPVANRLPFSTAVSVLEQRFQNLVRADSARRCDSGKSRNR